MDETQTAQGQTHEQTCGVLGRVSCWLGHTWTAWQDIGEGKVTDEGKVIGQFIAQTRRCLACNKVKIRYATVTP